MCSSDLERIRKQTGKSIKHWFITELGHEKTERYTTSSTELQFQEELTVIGWKQYTQEAITWKDAKHRCLKEE